MTTQKVATQKAGTAVEERTEELQVVAFALGDEQYGIDIGTVREIIRMPTVTQMPGMPDYVRGVINLRGQVIPVVDLRARFRLPAVEWDERTRVLVVDIGGESIGVVVDAVTEVRRVASDSVEAPGATTTTNESYYIEGIAKQDEHLLILLDLERALANRLSGVTGRAAEAV